MTFTCLEQEILSDNPTGLWMFRESDRSVTTADLSGNGNDLYRVLQEWHPEAKGTNILAGGTPAGSSGITVSFHPNEVAISPQPGDLIVLTMAYGFDSLDGIPTVTPAPGWTQVYSRSDERGAGASPEEVWAAAVFTHVMTDSEGPFTSWTFPTFSPAPVGFGIIGIFAVSTLHVFAGGCELIDIAAVHVVATGGPPGPLVFTDYSYPTLSTTEDRLAFSNTSTPDSTYWDEGTVGTNTQRAYARIAGQANPSQFQVYSTAASPYLWPAYVFVGEVRATDPFQVSAGRLRSGQLGAPYCDPGCADPPAFVEASMWLQPNYTQENTYFVQAERFVSYSDEYPDGYPYYTTTLTGEAHSYTAEALLRAGDTSDSNGAFSTAVFSVASTTLVAQYSPLLNRSLAGVYDGQQPPPANPAYSDPDHYVTGKTGCWYYIATTYDASSNTVSWYINGVLKGTFLASFDVYSLSRVYNGGIWASGGQVAFAALHVDSVLSADRIAARMSHICKLCDSLKITSDTRPGLVVSDQNFFKKSDLVNRDVRVSDPAPTILRADVQANNVGSHKNPSGPSPLIWRDL